MGALNCQKYCIKSVLFIFLYLHFGRMIFNAMLMKNIMSVIFIVAISVSSSLLYAKTATTLSINFKQGYQVIDSFGASDAWTFDPMIRQWMATGQEQHIEKLADTLFNVDTGIGLTAWRFNVGAGSKEQGVASKIHRDNLNRDYRRAELLQAQPSGPIDTTKQTGQIRFLQEAAERNVRDLIAFSNSPPVWATKNGLAHPDESVGSSNLRPAMIQKFALFLVDVVSYLRQQKGVPINYISPINEPTWRWQGNSQESNRYNIVEMKAVYHALYKELSQLGLENQISIEAGEVVEYKAALSDALHQQFSSNNSVYQAGMNNDQGLGLYKNYIDTLLGDPSMRPKIGNKISLHGYFSEAVAERMGRLRDLVWQNIQQTAPGAKVWMSEVSILGATGELRKFEGSQWETEDMDYALHVAKILHRDLTRLNASAWHWWLAVTPYNYKDGLIKVAPDLTADSIQTSKILWTLGQYSRFIRPQYQRIALTGADDLEGIMASAYKSPDDSKLIIVVINASLVEAPLAIELHNLPCGKTFESYRVYQTNQQDDLRQKSDFNLPAHYVIAPQSVITLVSDIRNSQPIQHN